MLLSASIKNDEKLDFGFLPMRIKFFMLLQFFYFVDLAALIFNLIRYTLHMGPWVKLHATNESVSALYVLRVCFVVCYPILK